MGHLYYDGRGVIQDYAKAAEYFLKGCELNNSISCGLLGYLYSSGQGITQDHIKAAEYLTKGCERNDRYSCGLLGYLYSRGQGVTQDHTKAAEYFTKGCERNDSYSCVNLGRYYFNGLGVTQDHIKAAEYFAKGCYLQDSMSCYISARLIEIFNDSENTTPIYERSCELKYAPACISLAKLYEHGQWVDQNDTKAAEYYAKGTELMTTEERQKFFSELLGRNKEVRSQQEELIQLQSEIEVLRAFNLDSEIGRNILQIQGNTN